MQQDRKWSVLGLENVPSNARMTEDSFGNSASSNNMASFFPNNGFRQSFNGPIGGSVGNNRIGASPELNGGAGQRFKSVGGNWSPGPEFMGNGNNGGGQFQQQHQRVWDPSPMMGNFVGMNPATFQSTFNNPGSVGGAGGGGSTRFRGSFDSATLNGNYSNNVFPNVSQTPTMKNIGGVNGGGGVVNGGGGVVNGNFINPGVRSSRFSFSTPAMLSAGYQSPNIGGLGPVNNNSNNNNSNSNASPLNYQQIQHRAKFNSGSGVPGLNGEDWGDNARRHSESVFFGSSGGGGNSNGSGINGINSFDASKLILYSWSLVHY